MANASIKGRPLKRVDLMFRAFSDRTRLRILFLLRQRELCVCDLVEILSIPQPKVSRHLAYLRKSGLVVGSRNGVWIHYTLARAATKFHRQLLNCLESCLQDIPELTRDTKRLIDRLGERC
jgi:ArsR family transcriptional regulator